MSPVNRNEILNKVEELAERIIDQEEVKLFQQAEKQIMFHKRIQELIRNIKIKQQELVNAKHIKKQNYIKQIEKELDLLNEELHSIPLVHQYQQSLAEVNQYFQSMIQLLKDEIDKNIPIDHEDLLDPQLNRIFQLKW